jgi:hypothetical protein
MQPPGRWRRPAHLEELARRFQRTPRDDVQEVLNALSFWLHFDVYMAVY